MIGTDPERVAYVASPEDVVLAKLEWFRSGGEVSERQLRDVLGVLKVQGERLDLAYLQRWAATLGVGDLLESALLQAQAAALDCRGAMYDRELAQTWLPASGGCAM